MDNNAAKCFDEKEKRLSHCCPEVTTEDIICYKEKSSKHLNYSEAVKYCLDKKLFLPQPIELIWSMAHDSDNFKERYWAAGNYNVGRKSGKIIRERIMDPKIKLRVRCVEYQKNDRPLKVFPFLPRPDFDSPTPGVSNKKCIEHGYYCPMKPFYD